MNIFSKAWGYLALIGAAIATVALAYLRGSKAGKDSLLAKQSEHTLKTVRQAREIRDTARALSDDDVDKRLSRFARKRVRVDKSDSG